MKSCEKYKNRGGKETEKEISKLFVPIPDWEEKSKPDFFLQNRNAVFRAAGRLWDGHLRLGWLPKGTMQSWGAVGSVHPTRRSVETAPPCPCPYGR